MLRIVIPAISFQQIPLTRKIFICINPRYFRYLRWLILKVAKFTPFFCMLYQRENKAAKKSTPVNSPGKSKNFKTVYQLQFVLPRQPRIFNGSCLSNENCPISRNHPEIHSSREHYIAHKFSFSCILNIQVSFQIYSI